MARRCATLIFASLILGCPLVFKAEPYVRDTSSGAVSDRESRTWRAEKLEPAEAVRKALPLLQSSAKTWTERSTCTSCHHQSLGSVAVATARERGFKVDDAMAADQVKAVRLQRSKAILQMFEGRGAINGQVGFSYALLGFAAENEAPNELTDAIAHFLMLRQAKDGGWVSESHRPPLEDVRETVTALAIRALTVYTPEARRGVLEARVKRAREWLLNSRPLQHEGRVMRLLGLVWTSAPPGSIKAAAAEIIGLQREDGGWQQIVTLDSDAYATGESLVALRLAGVRHDHPAVKRGEEFLLRTQLPDGSWRVRSRRKRGGQPYFETGYPHGKDQFISYAGSAWATIALSFAGHPGVPGSLTRRSVSARIVPNKYKFADDPLTHRLFAAVAFGTLADVRQALDAGASADARNLAGATPLHWAVSDLEKTRLLIARGAKIDARTGVGATALMMAALADGGLETMRFLLKERPNPKEPVKEGTGALSCAVLAIDREKVDLLLKAGAKVDVGVVSYTAPLAVAATIGDTQTVRRFLPYIKRFDERKESDGHDLLLEAIQTGNEAILELLLEAGANPNWASEGDPTALQYAAIFNVGHDRIVRTLLKHGADALLKWDGKTARQLAIEHKNTSVIAALR